MPPLDSNPQSQQANGRRPTPYTTRPRASLDENYSLCTLDFGEYMRLMQVEILMTKSYVLFLAQ